MAIFQCRQRLRLFLPTQATAINWSSWPRDTVTDRGSQQNWRRDDKHQSSYPTALMDLSGKCNETVLERMGNINFFVAGPQFLGVFDDILCLGELLHY